MLLPLPIPTSFMASVLNVHRAGTMSACSSAWTWALPSIERGRLDAPEAESSRRE